MTTKDFAELFSGLRLAYGSYRPNEDNGPGKQKGQYRVYLKILTMIVLLNFGITIYVGLKVLASSPLEKIIHACGVLLTSIHTHLNTML